MLIIKENSYKFFGVVILVLTLYVTFLTPVGAWEAFKIQRAKVNDVICNHGYCMEKATKWFNYSQNGLSKTTLGFCNQHASEAPKSFSSTRQTGMLFFVALAVFITFVIRVPYYFINYNKYSGRAGLRIILIKLIQLLIGFILPWIFLPVFS